jgi:hypothetical protein
MDILIEVCLFVPLVISLTSLTVHLLALVACEYNFEIMMLTKRFATLTLYLISLAWLLLILLYGFFLRNFYYLAVVGVDGQDIVTFIWLRWLDKPIH